MQMVSKMNLKSKIIHSWQKKTTSMIFVSKWIVDLDYLKHVKLYSYSLNTFKIIFYNNNNLDIYWYIYSH